ncbi:hypothetical protein GCM10010399_35540 [Dactylosporangium fulvum]|uniref:Aminoglycoside phosphotransferase family protein n=1 Tax=Dactylosporangium fulvum TaxID=53359 RepID=A0ABY5W4H5_9ACTN|nr:aminoglycoside phosphotransferase family protein [Dactylosporangium fulvum]UWP84968.1 aminoglycoside phosphotransferase family protein [Dactylosporangium fulvum]
MSSAFVANVVGNWGSAGRRWLDALPSTLAGICAEWGLVAGPPFELSFHYVAPVTCSDGTPAVLKLGVPGADSLRFEAAALAAFDGRGAVRLLRADVARAALLLERVTPGTRLRPVDDGAATTAPPTC